MIPIYLKSCYSFLSSVITIDDIIAFSKKKECSYACLCDDNMYGVMEFITKCEKEKIMPIVGLDLEICLLYAKNYSGYQNLLHLETIKSAKEIKIDDLKKYSNHLVCFVKKDSDYEEEIKKIYKDIYVYGEELKLFPTLCLDKKDLEIVKYLHLLRDNKTISDDIVLDENYCYHKIDNFDYSAFFNQFNLKLPQYTLNLPLFCKYSDTKGLNSDEYLENLSILGLKKRLKDKIPIIYKDRLLYELSIIKKMGFSNYFLIVYDYIRYAKSNNILVGPGRGSAAGSLVSYSLGITEVDPVKYNLLFERFLNPERVTMPDIDTDFPDIEREKVIDYCIEKYGQKHVSLITTFNTFGSKMAVRDMGRVLNIPLYIIDDLCKKIGDKSLKDIKSDDSIMSIINSDIKLKKLYSVALKIEGLPKNSSIHAAGVIMADSSLDDVVPLIYNDGRYLSGYEAGYLENLGLLKMDFLGIKNLTIIDNVIKEVNKKEKSNLKFNDLPLYDVKTNNLFSCGDTLGIFQFESLGMREFLKRLKPTSFEDVYNANAFYRPGPSDSIDLYLKRREGLLKVDYYDDRLEPILASTKGIMVYQEQIMQIVSVMANFTLGEADILRRAMSKKKLGDIQKFEDKFINNATKNGYSEELSRKIFNLILNFASYGFNKSHSVAYSMISYKMAYLKAHFPVYFYVSLLNGVLSDDKKTLMYLKEMRKYDIKVCKPDINKSMDKFSLYYQQIILPFSSIKGISSVIAGRIIENRGDCYHDIYDFFVKNSAISFPRNILETLILAGVFDSFSIGRKTLIENLDSLINYGNLVKELGQDFVLKPEINVLNEYSKRELIDMEKKSFGYYLSNHPVAYYRNKDNSMISLSELPNHFNQYVKTMAMIDFIKEIKTKKNEKMAFLEVSDEEEEVDIILFPKTYQTIPKLEKNDIIIIEGKVEKKNSNYNIIASKITNIKEKI